MKSLTLTLTSLIVSILVGIVQVFNQEHCEPPSDFGTNRSITLYENPNCLEMLVLK